MGKKRKKIKNLNTLAQVTIIHPRQWSAAVDLLGILRIDPSIKNVVSCVERLAAGGIEITMDESITGKKKK